MIADVVMKPETQFIVSLEFLKEKILANDIGYLTRHIVAVQFNSQSCARDVYLLKRVGVREYVFFPVRDVFSYWNIPCQSEEIVTVELADVRRAWVLDEIDDLIELMRRVCDGE